MSEEHQRLVKQYEEIAILAGGLAHEIRNPLSTIQMNLELLFEDLEEMAFSENHRIVRKLRTIRQETSHLEEILDAFLQFAQAGELHLEKVDFGKLVRAFLEFYKPKAESAGIELLSHIPSDLPEIEIDQRLIKQVLDNLVRNAQQAMPDGGTLEIQACEADDDVVIDIIDTGCGMSPQALEKMFDVFFSTKASGSGLGLPTVKKIVEAHGGKLDCESEVGRGTKFTLTLPIDNDR